MSPLPLSPLSYSPLSPQMGPLRKVTAPQVQQLHTLNSNSSSNPIQAPFRLLRIIRGPSGNLQATSPNHIMLRTLSMPGQDVFRSMQVQTSSKTPYSDATQVSQKFFFVEKKNPISF